MGYQYNNIEVLSLDFSRNKVGPTQCTCRININCGGYWGGGGVVGGCRFNAIVHLLKSVAHNVTWERSAFFIV